MSKEKKYKSTYERIMAEAEAEGRLHVLSEETNIKIMQELSSGSDDLPTNGIQEGKIFPSEDDCYLK